MRRTASLLGTALVLLLGVVGAPAAAADPTTPGPAGRIVVKVDVRSGRTVASATCGSKASEKLALCTVGQW